MGAAATAENPIRAPQVRDVDAPAARLFDPSGPTLEEAIVATWDELTAAGHATCPVCAGELSGTGCDRCGSELS